MQADDQLAHNLWWARTQREVYATCAARSPRLLVAPVQAVAVGGDGPPRQGARGRGLLGQQAPFVVLVSGTCHIQYQEGALDASGVAIAQSKPGRGQLTLLGRGEDRRPAKPGAAAAPRGGRPVRRRQPLAEQGRHGRPDRVGPTAPRSSTATTRSPTTLRATPSSSSRARRRSRGCPRIQLCARARGAARPPAAAARRRLQSSKRPRRPRARCPARLRAFADTLPRPPSRRTTTSSPREAERRRRGGGAEGAPGGRRGGGGRARLDAERRWRRRRRWRLAGWGAAGLKHACTKFGINMWPYSHHRTIGRRRRRRRRS